MVLPSILVTGGAGYIGSHVCGALKQRGYLPVTLDNLSNGHRQQVRFGPLVEGDISNSELIAKICAEYAPIAAMHFAALIDVGASIQSPEIYLQNNWEKSRAFIDTAKAHGITKIVFSSSASVYEIPQEAGAIIENAPLKLINPS